MGITNTGGRLSWTNRKLLLENKLSAQKDLINYVIYKFQQEGILEDIILIVTKVFF